MDKREKERIAKREFRKGIFEAVLVSSTIEDTYKFPTIQEFILSEFVNAVIKYTGGNSGQKSYR